MYKKTFYPVILFFLFVFSCSSNKKEAVMEKETLVSSTPIAYHLLSGYFLKNCVDLHEDITLLIASGESQMQAQFGMATTMSSKPDSIDFSKNWVIAIALLPSHVDKQIKIQKIEKQDSVLKIEATVDEKEKQTFTQTPVVLMSLEKDSDIKHIEALIDGIEVSVSS